LRFRGLSNDANTFMSSSGILSAFPDFSSGDACSIVRQARRLLRKSSRGASLTGTPKKKAAVVAVARFSFRSSWSDLRAAYSETNKRYVVVRSISTNLKENIAS
jgi:hypothetical protein